MENEVSNPKLDVREYDKRRLELDQQKRQQMSQVMDSALEEYSKQVAEEKAWKWELRKAVWDHFEAADIAREPRPVHHRIPNFEGADQAGQRLAALPEFRAAACVKVNPDTPQKEVRFQVLSSGKTLVTPQPRLRTGFFSALQRDRILGSPAEERGLPEDRPRPPATEKQRLLQACTSAGVVKHGAPIALTDESLRIDLIVVGSVAVDPLTGARIGKGEGFAELEYGICRWMGAVGPDTLVVTTCHDASVLAPQPDGGPPLGRISKDKLLVHDVPVDIIVTPTRVIRTKAHEHIPKPEGIYWDKLSPEKLAQIRVLRELKARLEAEAGEKLPTGPPEVLPPLAFRGNKGKGKGKGRGGRGKGRRNGGGRKGEGGGQDRPMSAGKGQAEGKSAAGGKGKGGRGGRGGDKGGKGQA